MPNKFSLPTSCLLALALTGCAAAHVSGSSQNNLSGETHTRQAANDEQEVAAVGSSSESEPDTAKDPLAYPVAGLPLPPGYSIPTASGLGPTTNFAAGNGLPNFQLPSFPPYFPQGFGVLPGPNYPGAYPIQGPLPGQGFPSPGQGLPPPGQGFGGFPEPGFPTPSNGAFLNGVVPGQGFPIPAHGGAPGQGFPIPAQGGAPGQGFPIPAQGGAPGQAFASSNGGQAFATSNAAAAGGTQGQFGPGYLATTIPGQGLPAGVDAQGFPTPTGFQGQPFPQGFPPPPLGGYFPGQFDTTVAADEPVVDAPATDAIALDEQPHDTVYGTHGGYVYEKP